MFYRLPPSGECFSQIRQTPPSGQALAAFILILNKKVLSGES